MPGIDVDGDSLWATYYGSFGFDALIDKDGYLSYFTSKNKGVSFENALKQAKTVTDVAKLLGSACAAVTEHYDKRLKAAGGNETKKAFVSADRTVIFKALREVCEATNRVWADATEKINWKDLARGSQSQHK